MPVKATKPVPDGMSTVTLQLFYNGNCKQAIEFYRKAFNAVLIGNITYTPDGNSVMHSMIRIGDTNLILADAPAISDIPAPENAISASLLMYVDNCDAVFNQAVEAGCSVIHEMMDAFWGDRLGNVRDPYGYYWTIASYKWVYTPEEMASSQEDWMKTPI